MSDAEVGIERKRKPGSRIDRKLLAALLVRAWRLGQHQRDVAKEMGIAETRISEIKHEPEFKTLLDAETTRDLEEARRVRDAHLAPAMDETLFTARRLLRSTDENIALGAVRELGKMLGLYPREQAGNVNVDARTQNVNVRGMPTPALLSAWKVEIDRQLQATTAIVYDGTNGVTEKSHDDD